MWILPYLQFFFIFSNVILNNEENESDLKLRSARLTILLWFVKQHLCWTILFIWNWPATSLRSNLVTNWQNGPEFLTKPAGMQPNPDQTMYCNFGITLGSQPGRPNGPKSWANLQSLQPNPYRTMTCFKVRFDLTVLSCVEIGSGCLVSCLAQLAHSQLSYSRLIALRLFTVVYANMKSKMDMLPLNSFIFLDGSQWLDLV